MGGSGNDGRAGQLEEEEQARKSRLRARIDNLYGIPTTGKDRFQEFKEVPSGQTDEVGNPTTMMAPYWREEAYGDTAAAEDAAKAMQEENTKLGQATREYHTDQLGKTYGEAERNTRFKLARQGLLGGSEDIYQQGDVREDRDLGATRVDDAVRRSIANLTSQREQERLNATNLVNSGAGDSAVSAAQAGLRNSFETESTKQKADLFSDLFAGSADAKTADNLNAQQAAQLARYRDQVSYFTNLGRSSSGRVTAS